VAGIEPTRLGRRFPWSRAKRAAELDEYQRSIRVATEITTPSVISDSIRACSATADKRSDPWRYQTMACESATTFTQEQSPGQQVRSLEVLPGEVGEIRKRPGQRRTLGPCGRLHHTQMRAG